MKFFPETNITGPDLPEKKKRRALTGDDRFITISPINLIEVTCEDKKLLDLLCAGLKAEILITNKKIKIKIVNK
jgi:hypothetical protein